MLAELRAKNPRHAAVADLMETMLDEAESRQRGVFSILSGSARFGKLVLELRRKAMTLLRGARNDNA